ncbi:hypothetical protein ACFLU4_01140 [Chloroflexota bacterium]
MFKQQSPHPTAIRLLEQDLGIPRILSRWDEETMKEKGYILEELWKDWNKQNVENGGFAAPYRHWEGVLGRPVAESSLSKYKAEAEANTPTVTREDFQNESFLVRQLCTLPYDVTITLLTGGTVTAAGIVTGAAKGLAVEKGKGWITEQTDMAENTLEDAAAAVAELSPEQLERVSELMEMWQRYRQYR